MKKLLKSFNLQNVSSYYGMIVICIYDGQREKAKDLFKKMPRWNRKAFVKNLFNSTGLNYSDVCMLIDII